MFPDRLFLCNFWASVINERALASQRRSHPVSVVARGDSILLQTRVRVHSISCCAALYTILLCIYIVTIIDHSAATFRRICAHGVHTVKTRHHTRPHRAACAPANKSAAQIVCVRACVARFCVLFKVFSARPAGQHRQRQQHSGGAATQRSHSAEAHIHRRQGAA